MSDLTENLNPEESENEQLPFEMSPSFPDEGSGDDPTKLSKPKTEDDPLAALRQSLLAEENQPEPTAKPDLLQRMTGSLASKKVPTRPRVQSASDSGFGVLTPRSASSEAASQPRHGAESEEIRDDFLDKRLGASEPAPRQSRPVLEKSNNTAPEPVKNVPPGLPKKPGIEYPIPAEEPRARPSIVRRLDPLFDGAEDEEDELFETPRAVKPIEMPSRSLDDRKMLGSGTERQFEVNRYLSYNPKQSLWMQLKSLSKLEQFLLVVLVIAVIAVGSLIASLYLDRRRPITSQNSATTGQNSQFPQVTTEIASGEVPVPVVLELPGGWKFPLKASVQGSPWTPTTSEWLSGTEIRRVVGVPWNRQIEAVVQTFGTEDVIILWMNNGDKQNYKVASVSQVDVQDVSVLHDTRPSLAVVLFNSSDNKRWLVIAYP